MRICLERSFSKSLFIVPLEDARASYTVDGVGAKIPANYTGCRLPNEYGDGTTTSINLIFAQAK